MSFIFPSGEIPEDFLAFANIKWSSCTLGYGLVESPLFVPAYRRDKAVTTYDAPGAQVSSSSQEVYGPAVELNGQYYADKMAYCRAIWATECNPNGSCPQEGLYETLLGRTQTTNYYGDANELIRTVVDNWAPTLTVAKTSDWRSGVVAGIPFGFRTMSETDLFRISRSDTTYYREGNANIAREEVYNSTSTRGVGLGGELDALKGIKTINVRTSTSTATVDVAPDRLNSASTSTSEQEIIIVLSTGRYQTPPAETGPYIMDAQIPVPLLFEEQSEIDNAVESYESYITRMVKGESYGLQIAEQLREDVATSWYPGKPLRYYDPSKDRLLAMRMDATSWGVSRDESAFVTDALWIGFSDGDVTIPENLVGNSLPDMGSGSAPPSTPVPPSVENENNVDSGSFSWVVNIYLDLSSGSSSSDGNLIRPVFPSDLSYPLQFTSTCFVEGLVVSPGDVLAVGPEGSVPLDYNGSLIVADATVVVADLFAA